MIYKLGRVIGLFAIGLGIGVCQTQTDPGTSLNINNLLPSIAPFKCAESYLSSDTVHGGTDYGAAISAAVQGSSLTVPTMIKLCAPGEHPIYTQAFFDRPIHFDMSGSKLVTQASMGSTPVVVNKVTVIAGSRTVAVSSTAGLTPNMAVGGLGITSGSYITSVGPRSITVSLMPSLMVNAYLVAGSTTVRTSNSLAGLAVGQAVTGYGIPRGTTISAITLSEPQSLTLSAAATVSMNTPVALSVSSGTWTVPTLTAVKTTPVIAWGWNNNALQNEFGQMVGGSMRNVWIVGVPQSKIGPGVAATPIIPGVQGVQIYGWDGFDAYNTRVEFIGGSGFIIGGYNISPSIGGAGLGSVRESYFYDTKVRYSGDAATGQPALSIISPFQQGLPNADEINQIGFNGGQLVSNYGEQVTIGTYDPNVVGVGSGPRLIWFSNNFQVESGNFLSIGGRGTSTLPAVTPQFDAVHIIQAGDIYFDSSELNGCGYGKALVRVDQLQTLVVTRSRVYLGSGTRKYTVGLTHGSPTVIWIGSDDGNGFLTDTTWNGIAGLLADGRACTNSVPCVVHLAPSDGVPSDRTLTLSTPYSGATNPAATLSMPLPGYMINTVGTLSNIFTNDNQIDVENATNLSALGATAQTQVSYVGGGYNPGGFLQVPSTSPGAFNQLTVTNIYDQPFLPVQSVTAPYLSKGHTLQRFLGQSGSTNNSVDEHFEFNGGPGSTLNRWSIGLFGSTNRISLDGNGLMVVPTVNGLSYQSNGVLGFSGTKTAGSCVFTISSGIITNVTGC